jgi:hypothetical protein
MHSCCDVTERKHVTSQSQGTEERPRRLQLNLVLKNFTSNGGGVCLSSEVMCRVVWKKLTGVTEVLTASTIRTVMVTFFIRSSVSFFLIAAGIEDGTL